MSPGEDFKSTLDSNEYFSSLPAYVREAIKQSDVPIKNEENLRVCAENLIKR